MRLGRKPSPDCHYLSQRIQMFFLPHLRQEKDLIENFVSPWNFKSVDSDQKTQRELSNYSYIGQQESNTGSMTKIQQQWHCCQLPSYPSYSHDRLCFFYFMSLWFHLCSEVVSCYQLSIDSRRSSISSPSLSLCSKCLLSQVYLILESISSIPPHTLCH